MSCPILRRKRATASLLGSEGCVFQSFSALFCYVYVQFMLEIISISLFDTLFYRANCHWCLRLAPFLANASAYSLSTSQLILQPFCCFTYITAHSPTTGSSLTSPGEPPMLSTLKENGKTVVLQWIPGHCNIHDNKQANALAKMGANLKINPQSPMAFGSIRQCIKQTYKTISSMNWT